LVVIKPEMAAAPTPLALASWANCCFQASKPPGPLPQVAACAAELKDARITKPAKIADVLRLVIEKFLWLDGGREQTPASGSGSASLAGRSHRSKSNCDRPRSRLGDREMRVRGCNIPDFARPDNGRCPIRKLTGFQPDVDAIKSNYRPLLLSLSPGLTQTRELQ
jgi:hypothetical protein